MRFPHAVTIVRPAEVTNRYGDTEPDWSAAARTPGYAWVQQRSADEVGGQRSATVSAWLAFMPAGTDVTAEDLVEWGARTLRVAGEPNPLSTPSGVHHLEVPLDLVEG